MTRRLVPAAMLAATIGLAPVAVHPAAADPGPVQIVLETTDQGYRCTEGCEAVDVSGSAWQPLIDVPLGSEVELVFVWAHEAYPNEEHIMVLDGYGLESEQIDADNREATLHFIADEPGSHRLKCDLHCDLHDYMQRAEVRVQPAGGGATSTPTYTPTSLGLDTPVTAVSGFEPVALDVLLTDEDGEPIERAELHLYVETEFGGVKDLVRVGTVRTDEQGGAVYHFRPLTAEPEQRVIARFDGMGVYDGAEQELALRVTGTPPPLYAPQVSRFEEVAGVFGSFGLIAVVLAIWATFAYVLLQVSRIARDGRKG